MLLLGKSIINGGDWNMAFTFPYIYIYIYIGNLIIPTEDSSSFLQRGGEKPPTRYLRYISISNSKWGQQANRGQAGWD